MRTDDITALIGNTPLLQLKKLKKQLGFQADIYAKLEYLNLTGSIKDRAALYMILDAEARGILKQGGTIIEPTSGNTGIGLAAIGRNRGYRVIIVMPDTMSQERIRLMKAYGAEVVLSKGSLGMKGAIDQALQLKEELAGSFIPDQFNNPANAQAHFETTGPEIERDLNGHVDALVAGVGTGGTITGIARYLKSLSIPVHVAAVEPERSPMLSKGIAGPHGIQGIGANFVPGVLDRTVLDEIITVRDEDALAMGRTFAEVESCLVGISSGAALAAAVELGNREEMKGKSIVVVLPDSGDRYLSTDLFGA